MKKDKSRFNKKEIFLNFIYVIAVIGLLGKLFYGEWLFGIGLVPIGVYLFKLRKRDIEREQKRKLLVAFKDMLVSVSDLTNTGYSVENAIRETYKELAHVYGEDSGICKEVMIMISQLKINVPTEKVIREFAKRTQLDEANTFSQTFSIAKKRGGSIAQVIKNITDTIVLKETVTEDIEVAISEKKLEQKIMSIIPLALVGYISFASPGFLDIMYETWMGRGIMSVCLVVYMVAFVWSKKISEIEV